MIDGRDREKGQERELCPILHLIGEVQHCSTPPTPKRSDTEEKKKWLGEGSVREIQKRKAYLFFF